MNPKKALAACAAALAIATPMVWSTVADAAPAPANCTSAAGLNPSSRSVAALTSDGRLVCFRGTAIGTRSVDAAITGLSGDTSIVGIDYRQQDGLLYGVGNSGGIYTINTTTAAAAKVGQISTALEGTKFGVDFNPAANALRVVSDTGQNLRIAFASGTPVTNVDTPLNTGGAAPTTVTGVVGAGYTNNDADVNTNTTLFVLNATANAVQLQSPANSGQVVSTGTVTPDVTDGDLDLYTKANGGQLGYALIITATDTTFYAVNVLTGSIGAGRAATGLVDIAVPLAQ
jgi:hypothetical protein